MEISKGLQKEIIFVQNKLKNAIRDHFICMEKLNDNPNNSDILNQIQEIQLNIVSLGKCQKQVIQRLRKEVEAFEAENANGGKVSVASLLGLNNNNYNNNNNPITPDNERKDEEEAEEEMVVEEEENVIQVKVPNGVPETQTKLSKEHYEDIVSNEPIKQFSAKIKHSDNLSIDEDVEMLNDDNSSEKHNDIDEYKVVTNQVDFLESLGLITSNKCNELQNKTAERKRRKCANSELVCSNWELPTKRKRHSYLQSIGNAPQTRQSTARLNGPSPPPATKLSPKSTSPTDKTKSITQQKNNSRPNIFKNVPETNLIKEEIDSDVKVKSEPSSKCSSPKNIPDSPNFLIEDFSTICINCRNPGILSVCENCSASYHKSCHSVSPPPAKLCPKCVQKQKNDDRTTPISKSEELVATTVTSGAADKTGKDAEICKTSSGFYQTNPETASMPVDLISGINQYPSTASYFIPIGQNGVATSLINTQPVFTGSFDISNRFIANDTSNTSSFTYSPFIINQFPNQFTVTQPTITSFISSEPQLSCPPLPPPSPATISSQSDTKSYLIVKKVSDPYVGGIVTYSQHQNQYQPIINLQLPIAPSPIIFQPQEKLSNVNNSTPVAYDNVSGCCNTESTIRAYKKPTTRAIPGLTRIAPAKTPPNILVNSNVFVTNAASSSPESFATSVIKQPSELSATAAQSTPNKNGTERCQFEQPNPFESSQQQQCHDNSMLPGDNKSNFVANCFESGEVERIHGIVRRLSQEQTIDSPATTIGQFTSSQFAEHVKLEEAHLSAPPPTNLKFSELNEKFNSLHSNDEIIMNISVDSPKDSMNEGNHNVKNFNCLKDIFSWKKPDNCVITKGKIKTELIRLEAGDSEETLTADEDEEKVVDCRDSIPTIDMQVLEDFESAMKEVDSDTANY